MSEPIKVVSVKLTSSENIIAQYIHLDDENGILTLKQPLKLISGIDQAGNEVCMFQRFDPASFNEETNISCVHVISINPVLYSFKQKYISSFLRLKLGDLEVSNESEALDYLTTHMVKMCEDIGVAANMNLLPIAIKKEGLH